jgi:hypothetical protein
MKKVLTVLAMLAVVSSYATTTTLKRDDMAITQTEARVVSVAPICPAGGPGEITCAAIGSMVTLKVRITGCLDRLGGYFHRFERQGNRPVLYFGALEVKSRKSLSAICPAVIVEEEVKVYVEETVNRVELRRLNFMGTF